MGARLEPQRRAGTLPAVHRLVASSLGLGLIPRRLRGSDAGAGIFGAALGAAIGGGLLAIDAWWVTALTAVALSGVSVWAASVCRKT